MSLAEQSASFVAHLQDIQDNPSKPLDPSILESYELVLQSSGAAQQVETLQKVFIFIAQLLPTLQQDPSPLVRVALKASAPLTYDHIAHVNLLPGLELIATPFHELIISLLDKAANANDIVRLAAQPEVIHSLVILWLCAQNIKTSELASELLLRYLRVSKNRPASLDQETAPKYGQGPMWKRLFGDKDIYELFFGICTLDPALKMFVISKNDRTVAQSRLMDWIPQVGTLDWDTILHSQHPSVSQKYGLSANEGLLAFAATKMVDTNDDILMHIRLLEFYKQLLECLPQLTTGQSISRSLEYLTKTAGIHERAVSYWLRPDQYDSLDSTFLSKPSAQYVGSWASTHPKAFAHDGEVAEAIRNRANADLNQLSPNQWARGMSPENDLIVLASLPPAFFVDIDNITPENFNACPLSRIPSKFTNADALNTLATIFQNTRTVEELVFPPTNSLQPSSTPNTPASQLAARATFLLYLSANPTLITDLTNHAEILAMKDVALAALRLLRSIATADWTISPEASPQSSIGQFTELLDLPRLPLMSTILQRGSSVSGVADGAAALPLPTKGIHVFACKTFRGTFFPWLLKPAISLPSVVGGRGDAEKAAYRVSSAKFDLIGDVHGELVRELKELGEETAVKKDLEALEKAVRIRLSEGVMGRTQVMGGQVATMQGA